jgi:hypothetical protein
MRWRGGDMEAEEAEENVEEVDEEAEAGGGRRVRNRWWGGRGARRVDPRRGTERRNGNAICGSKLSRRSWCKRRFSPPKIAIRFGWMIMTIS